MQFNELLILLDPYLSAPAPIDNKQVYSVSLLILTTPSRLNPVLHDIRTQLNRRLEFKVTSNSYKPNWTKSIKNEILSLF